MCLTLCDPMNCSLPGSSVHGIFQGRVLEWVTISFSKRSSWTRDQTQVSRIVGRCFTIEPPGKSGEESQIPKQIHSFNNIRKNHWLAQGRTRCLPVTLSSLLLTKERCTTWELWVKFYLGQNEDCSLGGSISDSSERLLLSGSGGKSIYKILVKGEFNAMKHSFYKRLFVSHEDLISPWRDLVLL